jgi:FtsP/CotA-like multicopper oxidase with cupredoxin domain
MKKYLLSLLVVVCLIFASGNAPVSAQHFNYDEAYQVMQGTWYDSRRSDIVYNLVWKSYDGSECNIVNGQGYTDPSGNSLIYMDWKGRQVKAYVTYYPDQNRYYARLVNWNVNAGKWIVMCESATKD